MWMLLVVDANELFSFFKKDSVRRALIRELPNRGFRLISPDYVFEELFREKERILKYAGINELQFVFLMSLLEKRIETFAKSAYEDFLPEAQKISSDIKDIPYFALALSNNCYLWSDEKSFKKQRKVSVLSTAELLKMLK